MIASARVNVVRFSVRPVVADELARSAHPRRASGRLSRCRVRVSRRARRGRSRALRRAPTTRSTRRWRSSGFFAVARLGSPRAARRGSRVRPAARGARRSVRVGARTRRARRAERRRSRPCPCAARPIDAERCARARPGGGPGRGSRRRGGAARAAGAPSSARHPPSSVLCARFATTTCVWRCGSCARLVRCWKAAATKPPPCSEMPPWAPRGRRTPRRSR